MENLPEAIKKVIEVLSDKFGTTGEKLWIAILKQQLIEGLFCTGVFVAGLVMSSLVMPAWFNNLVSPQNTWDQIGWIPFGFTMIVIVTGLPSLLYYAISNIFNPTYAAIKDISSLLKPE